VKRKRLKELFIQVDNKAKAIPDDTDPTTAYDKGKYYGASLTLSYLLGLATEAQWQDFLNSEHTEV